MKKIPFLLSTLTVTASLAGGISAALPQRQAWALDDITQTNREDIYSNNVADLAQYIEFEWFDFGANQLRFETGGTANATGIRAQRAVIAYRDFESGITEEEADKAAATLGLVEDSALITLVDSEKPALGNTVKPLKGKRIDDNLTDIIYFAVQFGHETADKTLEDSYWVRGKLDYRNCIHATVFEPEDMICMRNTDTDTGAIKYLPAMQDGSWVTVPENDAVKTWDVEWKEEVRRRLKVIDEQLRHIKTEVPDLGSMTFLMGKQIDKLQESTAKMENMADENQEMLRLEKVLQEVRTMLGWMIGEYQQEVMNDLQGALGSAQVDLNAAQQQIKVLKAQLLQAEQDAAAAGGEYTELQNELKQGREKLEQAQSDLAQMVEHMQDLQAKLQETEVKLRLAVDENDAVKGELGQIQHELEKVMAEKMGLMQEIADLAAKNADLARELQGMNQADKTDNTGLEAENAALKLENEVLKTQNAQLTSENEALKMEIQRLQRELEDASTVKIGEVKVGEAPLNSEEAQNNISSTGVELISEDVEVPNLGETEVKVNLWWILAGVVALLGATGLWCKRHLNKR